jgi:class I fructose-bisphosphate aldolase/fructose-bisphosphate aldolase/2-amino-3,7-dideoxy-D-threo-hept-6-ulosonate synthase
MEAREIRLKRLVGEERCVVVAIDHGMFDGPIPGMENLPDTASKINPIVDGVLLAPGMIRHCHGIFAAPKSPLAVVRLNWNTVYCFHWNYRQAVSASCYCVEDALREGMDIALVSLTLQTGDEQRDAGNIEVFTALTAACHKLGIPVIGEYFPAGHPDKTPEQMHEEVRIGSRICCELGADAIKTFHTCKFSEVTQSCSVPVLGLGAEKLPTQKQALELAVAEVAAGAGGVVFGRNAIQVSDPFAFQAALSDVVKGRRTVAEVCNAYALQ